MPLTFTILKLEYMHLLSSKFGSYFFSITQTPTLANSQSFKHSICTLHFQNFGSLSKVFHTLTFSDHLSLVSKFHFSISMLVLSLPTIWLLISNTPCMFHPFSKFCLFFDLENTPSCPRSNGLLTFLSC